MKVNNKGGDMCRKLLVGLMAAVVFLTSAPTGFAAATVIANGKKVKMDYTLTVEGKVVDTSKDHTPLEYTQGQGQILSLVLRSSWWDEGRG